MKTLRILLTMVGAGLALGAVCASGPAVAADDDKLPYWASIDAEKANMRVGPANSFKIDWVYRRMHLPVKVLRREGVWRQIEDPDGTRGWIHSILLSRQRGAMVRSDGQVEMRAEGNAGAPALWHLEPGVVGLLGKCDNGWCAFDVEGHKGFVEQGKLWGAGEP